MCTALGITVASYDIVKVWYCKYKIRNYKIQEAEHSGWLTDTHETYLPELVKEDQYSIMPDLGKE